MMVQCLVGLKMEGCWVVQWGNLKQNKSIRTDIGTHGRLGWTQHVQNPVVSEHVKIICSYIVI